MIADMRYCCLIIFGLAIASVALSCGRDKPRDVPMMDIINSDTPLEVTMADLVDSTHYVALETSDESILGNILSAVDAGVCYVVKDERNLYTFDKQERHPALPREPDMMDTPPIQM